MTTIKNIFFVCTMLILASCGHDQAPASGTAAEKTRQNFLEEIKKHEAEMHRSMTLDPTTAAIAVQAYSNFTTSFPNDSLTPDFLFKAAEISTANKQYSSALGYYQTLTANYPKYKLAPESLYLQGYLLDNYLGQDAKAKIIYDEVIAKYPALPYAADAKAAINNLGKSDEDLIREFEKKNKK